MSEQVEISVGHDGAPPNEFGATIRVLPDGRLQVTTDELAATLSSEDSVRVAFAILKPHGVLESAPSCEFCQEPGGSKSKCTCPAPCGLAWCWGADNRYDAGRPT